MHRNYPLTLPGPRLVRADGHNIFDLFEAILQVLPVEKAMVDTRIDPQREQYYDDYLHKSEGQKVLMEKMGTIPLQM